MNMEKQQAARAFAYSGAALLLGVIIFFFTQGLIPLVELPDIAGMTVTLGFVLIFLNVSFGLARRFCSRTFEMERFPCITGFIIVLPTLILSVLTERFSETSSLLVFYATIIVASQAGALFGIRSGGRKRDKLIREALETGGSAKQNE